MSMKVYTGECQEKVDKDGKVIPAMSATAEYDFHEDEDISVLCDVFGVEIVKSHALAKLIIAFQGWIRSQLRQGKTQEQITVAAADWKPGMSKPKKSKAEKALDLTQGMSDDEFDDYLVRLQEARKASAAGK